MGNCCSDVNGGRSAVGGSSYHLDAHGPNDAVDIFLKSRGYNGLFSQIEVEGSSGQQKDQAISVAV